MHKFKIVVILLLFFLVSCSNESPTKIPESNNVSFKETYTFYAMGTFISYTYYDEVGKEYCDAIEDIYNTYSMAADDYLFYDQTVSVAELNESREAHISKELYDMLKFADEAKAVTSGHYNPFLGRLTHLWKDSLAKEKLLEDEVVTKELAISQTTSLELVQSADDYYAKLHGDGNIDLGGLAKGYATSIVSDFLKEKNFSNFLLNAGSSNIVLGTKAGSSFSVGLAKALSSGNYLVLNLKNTAIGTSSIKEQKYLIDGKYYSHILNAKTGYPAQNYDNLSIIGSDSKYLDVFSTAGFSMEIAELKKLLETRDYGFIVTKNDEILYKSESVKQYETH